LEKTLKQEHSLYQGITLDITLTIKGQCKKIKIKVKAINNIIRKLSGSKCGAIPNTIRTTGLALCFTTGEYSSTVWINHNIPNTLSQYLMRPVE